MNLREMYLTVSGRGRSCSMGNELAVLGVVPVPGNDRTYEVAIEWNAQEFRFRFVVSDGPPRIAEGDLGWVSSSGATQGLFGRLPRRCSRWMTDKRDNEPTPSGGPEPALPLKTREPVRGRRCSARCGLGRVIPRSGAP